MKVWMPPGAGGKNHYGEILVGKVLGIVALLLFVCVGGSLFPLIFGWDVRFFSTIACATATALGIWLAMRLGQKSSGNALVFLTDESGNLYALDVRDTVYWGHHLVDYARGAGQVGRRLEELKGITDSRDFVNLGAMEILQVEALRERHSCYSLLCRVRYGNGGVGKRRILLEKGREGEASLIRELERRMSESYGGQKDQ